MPTLRNYFRPKYLFSTIFVLFLLLMIPLTVVSTLTTRDNRSKAATTPNDPCFVSNCVNFPNLNQWNLSKINAPNAWDITQGSSTVKVALLGTGVVPTLTDLQGQLGTGYNAISPGSSTSDDFSSYGDGTAVAGIIGAKGNNSTDMAGITWNTTMLPVKVCDKWGQCQNSVLAAGINWAVANGAKIVVISSYKDPALATPDATAAIAAAISQGVIVIASSGNYAGYIGYPANLPGVISVGSTDQNDVIASWSGRGSTLTLVAPGESITGLIRQGCCNAFTGGEFAAAQVAGAAALLLAAGVPVTQVQTALIQGAKDLGTVGYDTVYGNGRLDICGALNAAGKTCPVVASTSLDTDHDGFSDSVEQFVGTDPNSVCGMDKWPPDIDGDGKVTILDITRIAQAFGSTTGDAQYNRRYDLNADGTISILDLSLAAKYFGKNCSPL